MSVYKLSSLSRKNMGKEDPIPVLEEITRSDGFFRDHFSRETCNMICSYQFVEI